MIRTYDIKPIPTVYKGVKYRSRLEARYAVLFEKLGLEVFYEWEGFQLPCGWYVPDFWVPSWGAWIEVKPTHPTREELERIWAMQRAGQVVFCAHGGLTPELPGSSDGGVIGWRPDLKIISEGGWAMCPLCGKPGVTQCGSPTWFIGEPTDWWTATHYHPESEWPGGSQLQAAEASVQQVQSLAARFQFA